MHLALRRLLATTALTVPLLALAPRAHAADPTKQECIDANEKSGPLRQSGKLREARASLLRCSAASCPGVVRDDCIAGATRLEQAIPTIVFVAEDASGTEVSAVSVTLDGQPFAEKLDGTALQADPGEHVFTFTSGAGPAVEKRLILHEGEKNRRERIALGGASATTTPGPAPGTTTTPPPGPEPDTGSTWTGQKKAALVVGAVGVVGLGVSTVVGLLAKSKWEQAKTDCGPSCAATSTAQSEADSAHSQATTANVLFGLGAAAVVTGVVLWLLAPSGNAGGATSSARVAPMLGPSTVGLAATGSLP
jgi:hypothetical protein